MVSLPKNYQWLKKEPAPRMLLEALKLFGIKETPGNADNAVIMGWANECGISGYHADAVPWCGLFMAVVAKRARKPLPETPLWARAWMAWGDIVHTPKLGDVLVFERGNGGHVGLYVGEDDQCFHVLGGNQGDAAGISRVEKKRFLGARHCYATAQPPNCRPLYLASDGRVSVDEA